MISATSRTVPLVSVQYKSPVQFPILQFRIGIKAPTFFVGTVIKFDWSPWISVADLHSVQERISDAPNQDLWWEYAFDSSALPGDFGDWARGMIDPKGKPSGYVEMVAEALKKGLFIG